MEWGNLFKSYELFGQTRFVTVLLEIVGGAAEKYARARSGDTTFFIYLLRRYLRSYLRRYYLQTDRIYGAQKTRRRNLNKNISVAWNMVKNTINISEEGEENDSRDSARDSANDLLPCSEAFE